MKLNTGVNSAFPDQMVSEEEKKSLEYGLLVGQAIEYEWFRGGRVNGSRIFIILDYMLEESKTYKNIKMNYL